MFLSVVVPVYNVERYVGDCRCSLLNQPESLCEIIVVNDGTKDNSMEIVHKLVNGYTNVRIINQENKGLSEARNAGLRHALGEYVWFVDSDDTILENAVEYLHDIVDTYPCDVYASNLLIKNEKTNEQYLEFAEFFSGYLPTEQYGEKYNGTTSQRYIFRKKFLIDNNLFFMPGVLHEDCELFYRMIHYVDSIYLLDQPIYLYLLRTQGSIKSSLSVRSCCDLLKIHRSLMNFINTQVTYASRSHYRFLIFKIILLVFFHALDSFSTDDFQDFYKKNVNYMRNQSFKLFIIKGIGFKDRIKLFMYFISPLYAFNLIMFRRVN